MKAPILRFIFSALLLLVSVQASALELRDPKTALKTYVEYDDGMYNIQHLAAIPGTGFTAHLYSLTSQQWLTAAEINQPVWTHQLVVIVPNTVRSRTAMLFVSGNDNDDPPPGASDETVQVATQLALGSQSIVAALFQVPNQPLAYVNGPSGKEDKIVSWSWKRALDTGNYEWVMYLPMTKAVVKAMDGVQQVAPDLGYAVDDFVLTGFSKRGEAVYLAAAVDTRVKAIAPGVIDFLNFSNSFEHHYKSYGNFSPVVDSYVQLGILQKIRSPEFRDLERLIDPYNYREMYTMPKFILNSSGDEFFLPDSSRFYFDDLPGEKHIRFAPNTPHSLSNSKTSVFDTLYSLLGWYQTVLYGLPRPDIHWQVNNGVLNATTSMPPVAARVWRVHNPVARDFRWHVIGEAWVPTMIAPNADGSYSATLDTPATGFSAAYIEFVYTGMAGLPLTYSTQVYVTPDVYPFALNNPVNDPKSAFYWHHQVKDALAGRTGEISADTLNSYLPIPLFDNFVNTLDDMNESLFIRHEDFLDGLADRECMASRLNISNGQFGWYSTVDLGWGLGSKLLWQHYQAAHDAQADGFPWLSALICAKLNSL
jgi:PhoPQ-activated pathogenicity-related protein